MFEMREARRSDRPCGTLDLALPNVNTTARGTALRGSRPPRRTSAGCQADDVGAVHPSNADLSWHALVVVPAAVEGGIRDFAPVRRPARTIGDCGGERDVAAAA